MIFIKKLMENLSVALLVLFIAIPDGLMITLEISSVLCALKMSSQNILANKLANLSTECSSLIVGTTT